MGGFEVGIVVAADADGGCFVPAGSVGGGGRGFWELGLGSRGGGLSELEAGAGESSLNIPSGVSLPERSPLRVGCPGLRDPPVMKAPRLVLRVWDLSFAVEE